MERTYREIIIDWQTKKPVSTIEDFKAIAQQVESQKVLYQIYGDHHIYGRDVLLYIGISTSVEARFSAHLKGVFQNVHNKSVSLGVIANEQDIKLEVVESILIANHKPAFNKEYIHDIDPSAKQEKTIIINNGIGYMLQTCCTNFWWVDGKF